MLYLEFLRRQRRMAQWDLAEQVEISSPTLSLIESGRKAPSAAVLERLAAALKISPPEVLLKPVTAIPEETPAFQREA